MTGFILIALVGYVLLAAVAILDKFILTKEMEVSAYTFYSTVFFFAAFLLYPFSEAISFYGFLWALGAGLGFGFGMWAMFLGLRRGQATHVVPFIGAVTAVFVYGFSSIILGDSLSLLQTTGIVMLVIASLLFSYDKEHGMRKSAGEGKGLHPAFAWALLSGFLYAVSHVASKHFYGDYSFFTGIVWAQGSVGVVSFFTLLSAAARRDIFGKKSHDGSRRENSKRQNKIGIVIADKALGLAGTLAIQYSIATGSVAIVSGLVGLQYALIMVFAAASTLFYPRFFKEYFSRKEVFLEVVAIILVITGVFLLV